MEQQINYKCDQHDPCPRQIVKLVEDSFGKSIVLVDGGGGFYHCHYCPYCGKKVSELEL